MRKRPIERVKGVAIPAPSITAQGWWWMCRRVFFPFILFLSVLDVMLYLFFRFALDSCYGVMCLL